jgi:hypothetical protein
MTCEVKQTLYLLTMLAAVSTVLFEVLPESHLVYPMKWGGFEGAIIKHILKPQREHNILPPMNTILYESKISLSDIKVRVAMLFSPSECSKIEKLLDEWDMELDEFCKYCVTSVIEAHKE